MQLKLLGVLQDFDSPYASLYRDASSQKLYLAVEQECDKPREFCALLLQVSKGMVDYYLQHKIGLRELSKEVKDKYLWHRKKGQRGSLVDIGHQDVTKYINEADDMFDPAFCHQKASISYYLNS